MTDPTAPPPPLTEANIETLAESCRRDGHYGAARALRQLQATNAAQAAEIERLRKALQPFAEAAEELTNDHPDAVPIWEAYAAAAIDAGHLRAARRALDPAL